MNKFQSLCLGATLAATTMTTVALAPSSAMAITLTGNISVSGPVLLGNPANGNTATATLDWVTGGDGFEGQVDSVTHDFQSFAPALLNKRIDLTDMALTKIADITSNVANYSFNAVTNFINFGSVTLGTTTAILTFDLDAGVLQRTVKVGAQSIVEMTPNDPGLTGKFQFNGETIATGEISATQTIVAGVTGGVGGVSLSATAVPEPITMGGLALGTAFGAFMRKRYAKNDAKLQKA